MNPLIPRFVDAALQKLCNADLMCLPLKKMADAMRDPTVPASKDWVGWKAIPSTASDSQLDALETSLESKYPPLYRDFLKYRHFYELGGLVRFIEHPIANWEKKLRETYRAWDERVVGVGLIPFGDETFMDAGPTCFDTRHRAADGDCPVVFWDHEWVGTAKEIRPLFSSAAAMFTCLTFAEETGLNFIYHDADSDDATDLPQKKKLLRQFLDLDPTGAGSAAKDYWTSWGVNLET